MTKMSDELVTKVWCVITDSFPTNRPFKVGLATYAVQKELGYTYRTAHQYVSETLKRVIEQEGEPQVRRLGSGIYVLPGVS